MECRYRRAGARGGGRAAFPSWCRARLCPGRRRILVSGWQAEGGVESRGRDDVTAEARLCAQEREPDTAAESPRRASLSDWGHQAAAGLRATHLLNDENAYRLPVPFFCHAADPGASRFHARWVREPPRAGGRHAGGLSPGAREARGDRRADE